MFTARKLVEQVKELRWIDASTGQVEIQFFLYNTQRRMLSRISYKILFLKSGPLQHDVTLDSVRADNMLHASNQTFLIDILYAIWVLASIARFFAEFLASIFDCDWLPIDSYLICSDRHGLPELEIDAVAMVERIDDSSDDDDDATTTTKGGDAEEGTTTEPAPRSPAVAKRTASGDNGNGHGHGGGYGNGHGGGGGGGGGRYQQTTTEGLYYDPLEKKLVESKEIEMTSTICVR